MNVVPSAAWIVDPFPPVIALGEPGEGIGPPGPPDLGLDPPLGEFELVKFILGLITKKYTGTITAVIIKTKATKRRMMRGTVRRFDFGDVVVGSSSSRLSARNVPEPFVVASTKYESRGDSAIRGEELVAM